MFKMFLRGIALIVIGALTMLVSLWLLLRLYPARTHDSPNIQQIQSLSSLVTADVQVADVMLVDIRGITGGARVAAVIKGDYLLGTDLTQARFEQVDGVARSATLILAPPVAKNPRVDLEHSRLFGLGEYGLWQIVPGASAYLAVVNRTYEQAQQRVADLAADDDALQRARLQAETVLKSFFRALGWNVTVRWRDQ